jgi:rubrerythrin
MIHILEIHLEINSNKEVVMKKRDRKFSCLHCISAFTLKKNLSQHMKKKHQEKIYQYSCLHCISAFTFKTSLSRHMKKQHQELYPDRKSVKNYKFSCPHCVSVLFSSKLSLNLHKKTKHPELCPIKINPLIKSNFRYTCPYCGNIYTRKTNLNQHIIHKHKEFITNSNESILGL